MVPPNPSIMCLICSLIQADRDCMWGTRWDILLVILLPVTNGCMGLTCFILWDGIHLDYRLNNMLFKQGSILPLQRSRTLSATVSKWTASVFHLTGTVK